MHTEHAQSSHVAANRRVSTIVSAAILGAAVASSAWAATERSLIVNGHFARTYPARPSPAPVVRNAPALNKDSQLPCAWTVEPSRWPQGSQENIGTIAAFREDGKPALHVTTGKGEGIRLRQSVEVVPEARYKCSVWTKGKGSVALLASAQAPAVGQELGASRAQATADWTRLQFPVKIGYHRHVASIVLDIGENSDVLLTSAKLLAELPEGPLPEDLVTAKVQGDNDTLYFEDFDGPSCSFDLGKDCRLTDEGGGRFGRGLLVTPTAGGAKARMHIGDLPKVGTIEFWYKPAAFCEAGFDCNSGMGILALTTDATYKQLNFVVSGFYTTLRFGFRKEQWDCRDNSATCMDLSNPGWGFWQPGVWHHLAGAWDGQATRLYVDGQLEGFRIQGGLKSQWSCNPKNAEQPAGNAVDLILPAAGVIDEIRISKALRYGPFVPEGAQNVPLVMDVDPAFQTRTAAGGPHLETADKDLDEARLKHISPMPDLQAERILAATASKPGWEGMDGLKPMKDYFGPGADGVELDANREYERPSVMYWKLPADLKSGKYYIGLWQETGNKSWDWTPTDPRISEYSPDKLLSAMYLNGFPVRFATTSDPVQVKPCLWLAELQTADAVELKPGDEIAVRPLNGTVVFSRAALYSQPPVRGHGRTGQTFARAFSCARPFPQLRLGLRAWIDGPRQAGAKHQAHIKIVNPLPYAAPTIVDWKVADYYGNPLVVKSEPITLAAHAVKEIVYPFTAAGEGRAYQVDVKTRGAAGFTPPFVRPIEMIELNDWTKLEFLPNLPGPLVARWHERIDLVMANTGGRRALLLDGDQWDRAPLKGRRVPTAIPTNLKYQPVGVPNNEWWPPKGQFGWWYRKRFTVPAWLRGQSLQIEVGRCYREGVVFLNGKRLEGAARGGFPYRREVASLLKLDGENELVVLQRGDIAMMKEDYVDHYNPDAWIENDAHRDYPPSNENFACGLADVWLRALPAVHVVQTLVVPDVPKRKLFVFSRVQNTRDTPCSIELRYAVSQEGAIVAGVEIPAARVTIDPGQTAEVRVVGTVTPTDDAGLNAPNAARRLQLYTSAHPVLACISTSVVDDGTVQDTERTRFGYRSVSVEGNHLVLNGQPVTFLGTGPNIFPQLEGEEGTTIARMPPPLDIIDELGVFHYPYLTNTWPGSEWELINNDRYWQRDRQSAVDIIWQHASHPSCIGWDVTNECYLYACYAVGGEGQSKFGEQLASTAEEIRKRIWPGFWVLSDGNGNLGGRLNFTSWHYMNQGWSSGYGDGDRTLSRRQARNGMQVAFYAPDSYFINSAAKQPAAETIVRDTHPADNWHPGMACASTEDFWFTDQNNGPAIAKFLGDKAALSTNLQFSTGRGMWWGKLSVEGYRDTGASVMGVYALNFLGLVMQSVAFAMPEQQIRYYGGAKFDRRLTIHDDEFAPGKLEFTWKLLAQDGQEVSHETRNFTSGTSLLRRGRVAFHVPDVSERTRFTLDMTLAKNGHVRQHEQRVLDVWPKSGDSASAALQIALFDPQGKTQPIMERFGCKVTMLPAIAPEALADCRVLVIAPGAVVGRMVSEMDAIKEFTRAGGRVLLMEQTETGILPGDLFLEKRNYSSQGFVRAANHPVMRGLKDVDFAMWNPDHLIAKGLYRTPNCGNFISLVECFNLDQQANTMTWSPLWEMYLGRGSIVITQMPLLDTLGTEPMAAEMLRRILDYLGKDVYGHPQCSLAVCDNVSDLVLTRLKELRAEFKLVSQPTAADPVALLEMNRNDLERSTDSLRKYVYEGGTLILHRARPEHQQWLADFTGRKVTVEPQFYHSWVDRQAIEKYEDLVEGLSNIDFYWRPSIGSESVESQWQVSGATPEGKGQVEYVVKVERATEYLFPGGLVELRMGKGKLIVDQVKWELPERQKIDYGSPMRVISMLLGNLGVVERLPAPKPQLPEGVTYEPLDLSKLANVGFRDDKAGSGSGWCDWGPEQDIRDCHTGDIWLGAPYKIAKGKKNAIVLKVSPDHIKYLANGPESVEIPVGKTHVAGLMFLHTGGWTNGLKPFGWRHILYSDGTKEVMSLNSTNFADWNYGHDDFPDEEGTTTWVAWKGACKSYPITRVYGTLWVNPHPEKEIAKIVLTNAGLPVDERRFIAHIAVTLAMQGEAKHTGQTARDAKRSQALLQEALTLRQANKTANALAKLEESLKADDQNVGSWVTLTEIHATSDGVDAFTALCKRWFAAVPKNYQAHNMLGKFLESKGRLAEALAEYKRSLELEWNQPPTIDAKVRLEKQLNPK